MHNKSIFIALFCAWLLPSCVRTISLDPKEDKEVVVHCVLTKDSIQTLHLTYMRGIQDVSSVPINDGSAYLVHLPSRHNKISDTMSFTNIGDGLWQLDYTPVPNGEYELLYFNKEKEISLTAKTEFPKPHNVFMYHNFNSIIQWQPSHREYATSGDFDVWSDSLWLAMNNLDNSISKYEGEQLLIRKIYLGDYFHYFLSDIQLPYPNEDFYKYSYIHTDKEIYLSNFYKFREPSRHRMITPIYYDILPNDNYLVWIYGMDFIPNNFGGEWKIASKIVTDHQNCDNFNTTGEKFEDILDEVGHYDPTFSNEIGSYNHLHTLVHNKYIRIDNPGNYDNGYLDSIKAIINGDKKDFIYYDIMNKDLPRDHENYLFPNNNYFEDPYKQMFSSMFIIDGNFNTPYMYNDFIMNSDNSDTKYGGKSKGKRDIYFLSRDSRIARKSKGSPFPGIMEDGEFDGFWEEALPYQGYLSFMFVSREYDEYLKSTYKLIPKPVTDITELYNNRNMFYTNVIGGAGIFGACYEVRKNAF